MRTDLTPSLQLCQGVTPPAEIATTQTIVCSHLEEGKGLTRLEDSSHLEEGLRSLGALWAAPEAPLEYLIRRKRSARLLDYVLYVEDQTTTVAIALQKRWLNLRVIDHWVLPLSILNLP